MAKQKTQGGSEKLSYRRALSSIPSSLVTGHQTIAYLGCQLVVCLIDVFVDFLRWLFVTHI